MISASQLAKYLIVKLYKDNETDISPERIQTLLYYCQGLDEYTVSRRCFPSLMRRVIFYCHCEGFSPRQSQPYEKTFEKSLFWKGTSP